MPRSVKCPKCQKVLTFKSQPTSTKRVRCPKCQAVFALKPPKAKPAKARPKARPAPEEPLDGLDEFDGDFESELPPMEPESTLAPARGHSKGGNKGGKKSKKKGGKKRKLESGERSLTWVVVMLLIVVTGLGWACAAAVYAHNEQGWRQASEDDEGPLDRPYTRGGRAIAFWGAALSAFVDFLANAVKQIPNAPAVIGYTFSKKFWIVIVVLIGYAVVGLLAWGARTLEKRLEVDERRMI